MLTFPGLFFLTDDGKADVVPGSSSLSENRIIINKLKKRRAAE